jgi:predicted metalloprotease with PDZ domain
MERPSTHYFDVEINVDDLDKDELRAVMPVWTPGSYLVREFSKNVLDFRAYSKQGKPLQVEKVAKNIWEISIAKEKSVRINYSVYAFEIGTSISYFDENRATINGAGIFCYLEGMQNQSIELEIIPDKNFRRISTALKKGKRKNSFVADNYDVLVDSPMEVGNHAVYHFTVKGRPHEVALYGSGNLDVKMFIDDVKKIVEAAGSVFGEYPYSNYVFLTHLLSEKGGGLEHLNSTLIRLQRWSFKPRSEYLKQLTLIAHEFFHLWNVKRLRPEPLTTYDYTKENYTKLLWVSEGITSYYENEILRRAKICSIEEFLDTLLEDIETLEGVPGRRVQSLEEASFDAWIKYYRQDENFPNSSVSYYAKGAVVGWMLDMEIKKNTSHRKALDDVLRLLYKEAYQKGKAFSEDEFESACEKISGAKMESFFEDHVRGTKDIDYNKWFGLAGLRIKPAKKNGSGFLGVRVRSQEGKLLVSNVMKGSPAEVAGVSANDEIIAFNGFRVDEKNLQNRIAEVPAKVIPVLVARGEAVHSLDVEIGQQPNLRFWFERISNATKEQKEFFEKWLGQKWEKELRFTEKSEIPQEKRWI